MTSSCSKEAIILYKLHFLNKEVSSKFEWCTGMSQSRLELILQLFEVGEISQKALQQEVNIDNAAITRHLKQLEANEMIVRRKNPDDNRITLVSLTEEGRNKIQAFQEEKERFAASAFKGLSEEERDNLLNMLIHIQENIKEL
ncbi:MULTISPECIES: MarR family winged helix-turn-helix transcriptional regulator [Bacillus cereus group]|uniref:MarR family winged helix-turn-helix transcriptional regulator n=1 Tax=Bacillus cereus group TaxID=86661 RepID=UPI0022E30AB2|nr:MULTISPECIES: MarR family transcriptional regulator [unclassified Bacillus cereus group]MDA2665743.1 MarR family transcriptional regulator [Bacillus cereus group sp. Bc032]MDA2676760.1 MarR family transcriptional regulator [Bacillus cereus group sp. Bc031]MDA2682240.1 MarR family transcriptional regulator [Bacillus cereus group sp. Bc029]MDA2687450.1 MarR family transcriptional regulator [Bacillus cereus group sp. Bc030]MDA2743681.1 MarR family transcriptional regulator [Bacillus cereus gro